VREKAVDPRIRQPDRVEHSVLDLGDPGRRIPSRGSGVTLFVTNGTKERAIRRRSQGIEAAEAFRIFMRPPLSPRARPLDAEPLDLSSIWTAQP